MSASHSSSSEDQSRFPVVRISYECISQMRTREADSYYYELACSISYPVASGHLSVRVTGQNTYRRTAARDVPFTRHETGATTYVELLEAEHLEVRIVELDGSYSKAFYYAYGQELTEQNPRRIVSTIQRIDSNAGPYEKYK
ncbi:MAG TPA: hypothetical protein VEL31_02205 [Ktedonobacteraceae bacterium]|nr:hypothetical protein [Ktedonobacteraceae bacterium]